MAKFVEMVHRQKHTDEQKANAIASVYQTINISPQKAIQFVKQMHNDDFKEGEEKK